jgi:hypothetical protein
MQRVMLLTLEKWVDVLEIHEWAPDLMYGHELRPTSIHTKSHQLPFQECWSIHTIHKLPDKFDENLAFRITI